MAQPKLSNATIQPLLVIGPFDGVDATTDPAYIEATYARDAINFVPNHAYRGLAPIRGRVGGIQPLPQPAASLAIFYPHNQPATLFAACTDGSFNQTPAPVTSPWTPVPVPPAPNGATINGEPGAFARYKAWLFFTNGNNNGICYKFDSQFAATFWGIYQPPSKPALNITSPNGGMIYGNAYYYRYTYAADNTTDPGLSQESSPSAPAGPFNIGTSLSPPVTSSATQAQFAAPTVVGNASGGSIPDGTYAVGIGWITNAGPQGISKTANAVIIGGGGAGSITITPVGAPAGATGYNVYTNGTQQGATRSGVAGTTEVNFTNTGPPPPAYTGFLSPPAAPIVKTTTGGSLPARTEYYQLTYVNANGETTPSFETAITLSAGQLAVVQDPGPSGNATGYNVYGSTTSAQEILQNNSPITFGNNWTEPNIGLTLGQSAVLTLQGSPDPQVTSINVYRIGGQSLGNWYFVGSVPNPGGNHTTTFTDNTPDSQVTGQALVLARDPPAPFFATFEHLDRLMGFGYDGYTGFNGDFHGARRADLWYSNYAEPWGFDNTNQVLPVGSENAGDIAINGGSLGGIAILWKNKTTWALYGSSPSDFFVSKLFDIGAVTAAACFIALGVAFWLSQQGMYMYDGATLTYISKPIKAILDGMSQTDFAAACGTFDDRMAWWSFPTVGIALGYDMVSQNWFKASLTTNLFAFDTEAQSRATAPDWVFGAASSIHNPGGPIGIQGPTVDQWFAATTDYGAPIGSSLITRTASSGEQIGTMRTRYIELGARSNITDGDSVLVTVTANPASTNRSFTKAFGPSPVNLRQRASVPPGIQGDTLQLQVVASTSDGLVLDGAAAHGWVRRLYNVVA